MIEAVDCQSFAGGFTLGMARAGFKVVAKREAPAGFGIPMVEANIDKHLPDLGDIVATDPGDWPARRVPVVFGNPPCSGFSGLTGVSNRTGWDTGANHAINQCMWDFVAYAAKCKAEIAIMESVQLAYRKGLELMRELRLDMEERTGKRYDLIHVLHNNASVGGASIRKRYFMVLARRNLKFGILPPNPTHVPTMGELLYDLEGTPPKVGPVKYRRQPKCGYAASLRSTTGYVEDHFLLNARTNRMAAYLAERVEWLPSEHIGAATRRLVDQGLPPHPEMLNEEGHIKTRWFETHAYAVRRWPWHKAPGVVTGTAAEDIMHPTQPRTITYREAGRIMGFPDDWSLEPMTRRNSDQLMLGKGISVPCGEWIGHWAKLALEGNPGPWRGEPGGEQHEWVIDVTNDHKAVYDERTGEKRDSRTKELKAKMEARTW